jgi:hypothetical protein
MQRSTNRRTEVQAGPGIKQEPISKITNTKKGYQSGSSGRVPVLQARVPEFKTKYFQKKKKHENVIMSSFTLYN